MSRLYTKEHEWVLAEGNELKVGISDYAQQELGDVVYVQLPEVGSELKQGETFMTVESVKAVSDIYAPVDGRIIEVNTSLDDAPELINSSPEDKAWLVSIEASNASQLEALMGEEEYAKLVASL